MKIVQNSLHKNYQSPCVLFQIKFCLFFFCFSVFECQFLLVPTLIRMWFWILCIIWIWKMSNVITFHHPCCCVSDIAVHKLCVYNIDNIVFNIKKKFNWFVKTHYMTSLNIAYHLVFGFFFNCCCCRRPYNPFLLR